MFSEASDCWSLGIVFWEICTMGAMPYAHVSNMDMLYFLIGGDRVMPPLDCPDDFWAIMLKCWEEAPEDRWSFTELTAALKGLFDKYPGESTPRDLGKHVAASKGEKVAAVESEGKEEPKYVYDVPLPNEADGYDIPIKDEGGDGSGGGAEDAYDVPIDSSGPSVADQAAQGAYDIPIDGGEDMTTDTGMMPDGTGTIRSMSDVKFLERKQSLSAQKAVAPTSVPEPESNRASIITEEDEPTEHATAEEVNLDGEFEEEDFGFDADAAEEDVEEEEEAKSPLSRSGSIYEGFDKEEAPAPAPEPEPAKPVVPKMPEVDRQTAEADFLNTLSRKANAPESC